MSRVGRCCGAAHWAAAGHWPAFLLRAQELGAGSEKPARLAGCGPMGRPTLLVFIGLSLLHAADIPRPEYPQPQFQREQWMSLNGRWEFAFDDHNRGLEENWAAGAKRFDRSISVPFCFESTLSGIGDRSFHPW